MIFTITREYILLINKDLVNGFLRFEVNCSQQESIQRHLCFGSSQIAQIYHKALDLNQLKLKQLIYVNQK